MGVVWRSVCLVLTQPRLIAMLHSLVARRCVGLFDDLTWSYYFSWFKQYFSLSQLHISDRHGILLNGLDSKLQKLICVLSSSWFILVGWGQGFFCLLLGPPGFGRMFSFASDFGGIVWLPWDPQLSGSTLHLASPRL